MLFLTFRICNLELWSIRDFWFSYKMQGRFELHNGQLPLCPWLGALPDPPKPVSSIQVAPSDIFWVFWEWTKLVLDIGNFLARATIWFLTLKRINSKHFEISYLTKRFKRKVIITCKILQEPLNTSEAQNLKFFFVGLFIDYHVSISLLAASWRLRKAAGMA